MKKMEIWKPIPEYEGYYEVSSIGRVRSIDRIVQNGSWTKPVHGRILKLNNNDGYMYCCLCKDGKPTQHKVHRLVALAFIPNPNNLPYINHKNEDKSDNRVENLEWCTKWYNEHYGSFHEKSVNALRSKLGKPVIMYSLKGEYIREFECMNDAKALGFSSKDVLQCCKMRQTSSHGVTFRYKGEPFSIRKYVNNIIVQKIDKKDNIIATYNSIKEAERSNGYGSYALRKHHLKGESEVIKDGFRYVFLPNSCSGLPTLTYNNI